MSCAGQQPQPRKRPIWQSQSRGLWAPLHAPRLPVASGIGRSSACTGACSHGSPRSCGGSIGVRQGLMLTGLSLPGAHSPAHLPLLGIGGDVQSLPHLRGVQVHPEVCGVGARRVHPHLPGCGHPEQALGESQESPCHSSTHSVPSCSHAGDACSPVTQAPGLTCRQENFMGTRMKELPRSCVTR